MTESMRLTASARLAITLAKATALHMMADELARRMLDQCESNAIKWATRDLDDLHEVANEIEDAEKNGRPAEWFK
jgi:hypothetical protein